MLLDQMNELRDARLIKLPKHAAANGDGVLVVAETAQQVPFQIQGMFTIVAPAGHEDPWLLRGYTISAFVLKHQNHLNSGLCSES
jgi:hypothetical protein